MGDAGGDAGGLCLVCWSEPSDVVLTACGHLVCCDRCAGELLERGQPCPLCREPVRAVGGTRCVEPAASEGGTRAPLPSYLPDLKDPVVLKRARERPGLAAAAEEEEEEAEVEESEEEEVQEEMWAVSTQGQLTLHRLRANDATLTELDLSGRTLENEDVTSLAGCLGANTTLTRLNLCSCRIDDADATLLAPCLYSNKTLTSLNLRDNSIGDAGAKQLAVCLFDINKTLTDLDLGDNLIGNEGAKLLGQSLSVNTTLAILHLENNDFSDVSDLEEGICWQIDKAREAGQTMTTIKSVFVSNFNVFGNVTPMDLVVLLRDALM